ncbi:MAG: PDZ domain-containing protein [Abditibacteriales bacterium]|nr:PDZ domain-containing protein [Abditibacteriales bacterium]MDW8366270.1 PDZ domain-containing protein [Abditibacteriales bacterium]
MWQCVFLTLLLVAPPLAWRQSATAPTSHRVPYRLTETQHLLVRAKLNGRGPFNFIIDTGAPAVFVSKDVAGKIGVKAGEDGWATLDRLEVEGGAVVERIRVRVDEPFQLQGMNAMGLAGARMDGVFGYNLLAHFRIEIDLTQPAMTWTKLNYAPPPPLPLNALVGDQPITPPKNLAAMEGLAKLATRLLPRSPEDPVVPRGFFGMELSDDRNSARVQAVLPQSPAAQGGLRAGDRITHITLPRAAPQAVRSVADVLRVTAHVAPDEVVHLTVVRDGKTVDVSVRAGKGGL